MSGNVFLGPLNRGPFDPTFEKNGDESLEAFEFDVQTIIGSTRYSDLLLLFNEMLEFVQRPHDQYPFSLLLSGLRIFFEMSLLFSQHSVTLFNSEQWEERVPTDQELMNVKDENFKKEMKTKEYWAIKKRPRRSKRIINYQYRLEIPQGLQKNNYFIEHLKIFWRKFIVDLMMISTEATNSVYSPIWSCDFIRLFNEYLVSESSINFVDCSNCSSFNEFLYSKISDSPDWNKCNDRYGQIFNTEWCLAWKRIKLNLKTETSLFGYDKSMLYTVGKIRSETYYRDIKSLMSWVSSTMHLSDCPKNNPNLIVKYPSNPFQPPNRKASFLDISLCHFSTFLFTLLSWKNDCKNVL